MTINSVSFQSGKYTKLTQNANAYLLNGAEKTIEGLAKKLPNGHAIKIDSKKLGSSEIIVMLHQKGANKKPYNLMFQPEALAKKVKEGVNPFVEYLQAEVSKLQGQLALF